MTNWFTKLKNWLFAKNKGGEERMPSKFMAVRFKEGAKKSGLHGDRQKNITIVENGSEKTYKYPYQKEIMEAFREELNMPVLPETGDKAQPEPDVLDEYDPGKISWFD